MTTISTPDQIFDVRLVERHIDTGLTTKKEYEQFMKQLPDVAGEFEYVPKEAIFDLETPEDENDIATEE
ncbi:MAG: hypothetical protein P9L99_13495 [Candidatus Lernaella stagnicola]|nr:hypothetical protein [Candidatus Lernaella stagnicola]